MKIRSKMKKSRVLLMCAMVFLLLGIPQTYATLYTFEIFTTNGSYSDDPGVSLWMEVSNGAGVAEFTFYNNSTVDSSIARIYFDDGTLLGITNLTYSSGVQINEVYPGPGNLPSGGMLDPPFVADREFSIGGEAAPSQNGIDNIGEWVKITFDLVNGGTLDDVIGELNSGELRVGVHLMAFPDGSSESAIGVIPEPASVLLLGLGALVLLRRRRA